MSVRRAVRALLLDPDGAVLLTQVTEPITGASAWITPGGGLDDGETAHQALRRELHEELGHDLDPDHVGPHVWTRRVAFTWNGCEYEQHEEFFLLRTERFTPEWCVEGEPGSTWDLPHRWWTPEEIDASADTFFPRRLGRALAALVADGPPAVPYDVGA